MPRTLTLLLLLSLCVAGDDPPEVSHDELRNMIFFSVLEGLYEDGVDNASMDVLLAREPAPAGGRYTHFVYACPICMPAINAMLVYRARPEFYGWKDVTDTFGKGLPEETRKTLATGAFKQRLTVLHDLLQRWIARRLDRTSLTAAQRAAWHRAIEEGRKEGMKMLAEFQRNGVAGSFANETACAACDGAMGACSPR